MTTPLTPPIDSALEVFDLAELAHGGVEIPQPDDAFSLFYSRHVHSIAGEPGLGKSWLGLAIAAEAIHREQRVIFIDFEDGPVTAVTRLAALGVPPSATTLLTYLRPVGRLDAADMSWLTALIADHHVALVVIDSVPEALALHGLDENSSMDISAWFQQIPRPLARAGATVLVVDHVTKATEGRGRWARGSGAKLAAIDGAAYILEPTEPFSRERSGHSVLRVAKDRHGAVGGASQPVRTIHFDVAGGSLHQVRIGPYEGEPGDGSVSTPRTKRPDAHEVRAALTASGGTWLTRRDAAEALGVGSDDIGEILQPAVRDGLIVCDHPSERTYVYTLPDLIAPVQKITQAFPGLTEEVR
jgi:hypothetical protein